MIHDDNGAHTRPTRISHVAPDHAHALVAQLHGVGEDEPADGVLALPGAVCSAAARESRAAGGMSVIREYVEAGRGHLRKAVLLAWLRPKDPGLVRIGSDHGGKWMPRSILRAGAVAYCAGAGEDVSFDLALADAGLRVSTFDPTPRAIEHVRGLDGRTGAVRFVPVGWWDDDTVLRFYAPVNPADVSHSAMNLRNTTEYFEARVKPVQQLMTELGDDRVDLVKMDIEGAELRVIPTMLEAGVRPEVLNVEFDQPQPLRGMVRTISLLRCRGYRLVKVDRWDFTFLLHR